MSGGPRDDEPVFVRSKWGTNRYVYNPNNPLGLVLIIGSLLLALGGMYYLRASSPHPNSTWSEGELRSAVHQAAQDLEKEPQYTDTYRGYGEAIKGAVEQTGKGPSYGVRVSTGPYNYTVTGDGTDAKFCMHVIAMQLDGTKTNASASANMSAKLSIDVTDGGCG
ncbi:hypothetical protein [Streptomyces sp. NBC_01236]|uniref:hypothetical protein n=1 Tax=Streptomyces sp. NBC_01236 TaxID=2903789 RepID=UPI002E121A15|nr:hypothetical protein OG324_22375 [Streptomyces sp. NBC_01236]